MRKPDINHRPRVCIVCEGYEEEAYVNALIDKGLWPHYRFKVVNAKGAGNVTARFQNEVSADSCEAVLVFCDTDRRPFDEYLAIKGRLRAMLGQKARFENLVIYANPSPLAGLGRRAQGRQVETANSAEETAPYCRCG